MKLEVYIKNVYGNEMIYPHCAQSQAFLKALGLKTFTPSAITAVKALGFELIVVPLKVGAL